MLFIAGIFFVLAMLLLFVNWWVSSAEMDLTWAVRILIFIALALVLYNFCKKQPVPPAPVKTEAQQHSDVEKEMQGKIVL